MLYMLRYKAEFKIFSNTKEIITYIYRYFANQGSYRTYETSSDKIIRGRINRRTINKDLSGVERHRSPSSHQGVKVDNGRRLGPYRESKAV